MNVALALRHANSFRGWSNNRARHSATCLDPFSASPQKIRGIAGLLRRIPPFTSDSRMMRVARVVTTIRVMVVDSTRIPTAR